MFRDLIIFTVLLNLTHTLMMGVVNITAPRNDSLILQEILNKRRTIISEVYGDFGLTQIQHRMDLLSRDNLNLRLLLEQNNERMDRHLTGIVNAINNLNKIFNFNESSITPPPANTTNPVKTYSTSCLKLAGGRQQIKNDIFSSDPFYVYCDNVTHGGGWTVIQRRMDGSVDFFRNWEDYKRGFGNLTTEFFIGLEKLHALTSTEDNELLIVMRDKKGKYEGFAIGDESEYYALKNVGRYSGDAGDSLSILRNGRFFTKDRDCPEHCGQLFETAWWIYENDCFSSLNGKYGTKAIGKGINWESFTGLRDSLTYVQMMIRPRTRQSVVGITSSKYF